MRIKSYHLASIIMVFLFSSIALTSALGLWKTSNDKVPATYKDGDFAGQNDPDDIRGSYSFEDIYNAFDVPLEDLGKAFGIQEPEGYASFQCKDLENLYASLAAEGKEVGTSSVKYFVALYKGLPYNADHDTYLPRPAVEILKSKNILTAEQIAEIEKYIVELPASASIPAMESSIVIIIKGNTTFKDLLDLGVTEEGIEKAIKDKMPDSRTIIKDYAGSKAIEFSTIKAELQKLADDYK